MMKLPRDLIRRRGILALSILGALWILMRAFTSSDVERLSSLALSDQILGIRDGQVYLLRWQEERRAPAAASQSPARPIRAAGSMRSVLALPLSGGRARELASIQDPAEPLARATLTAAGILVALVEPALIEQRFTGGPQDLRLVARLFRRPGRTRILEVPLNGGPAHTLPVEIPSDRVALVGRQCYWIDVRPDREESIPDGKRTRTRRVPRSRLMVTPLDGGPARVAASQLPWYGTLEARGNDLFWLTEPEPPARGHRDLYFYSSARGIVEVFHDYTGLVAPEVDGDRFYWMVTSPFIPDVTSGPPPDRPGVMSARHDGSDLRTLVDLRASRDLLLPAQLLSLQGEYLYCLFQTPRRFRANDPTTAPLLCRVERSPPHRIRKLEKLPAEGFSAPMDEKYYYGVLTEHPDDWFDWSPQGIARQHRRVLYRVRLPEPSPSG